MANFEMALLAQSEGGSLLGLIPLLFMLAVPLVVIAGAWKAFAKAGEPGWAALVPIYNAVVFLRIAGKPAWWIVLMVIPVVNLIVSVIVAIEFAKAYGKGVGFGVGIAFLSPVFVPVLGFGSARCERVTA